MKLLFFVVVFDLLLLLVDAASLPSVFVQDDVNRWMAHLVMSAIELKCCLVIHFFTQGCCSGLEQPCCPPYCVKTCVESVVDMLGWIFFPIKLL